MFVSLSSEHAHLGASAHGVVWRIPTEAVFRILRAYVRVTGGERERRRVHARRRVARLRGDNYSVVAAVVSQWGGRNLPRLILFYFALA